jgi:hypothetical protein
MATRKYNDFKSAQFRIAVLIVAEGVCLYDGNALLGKLALYCSEHRIPYWAPKSWNNVRRAMNSWLEQYKQYDQSENTSDPLDHPSVKNFRPAFENNADAQAYLKLLHSRLSTLGKRKRKRKTEQTTTTLVDASETTAGHDKDSDAATLKVVNAAAAGHNKRLDRCASVKNPTSKTKLCNKDSPTTTLAAIEAASEAAACLVVFPERQPDIYEEEKAMLRVSASTVHGLGVFANQAISAVRSKNTNDWTKKDRICRYSGKYICGPDAIAISKSKYIVQCGDWGIDSADISRKHGCGRYINHAHPDAANVKWVLDDTTLENHIYRREEDGAQVLFLNVFPIKDIEPDEELFVDYGKPYWTTADGKLDKKYYFKGKHVK